MSPCFVMYESHVFSSFTRALPSDKQFQNNGKGKGSDGFAISKKQISYKFMQESWF